jgi:hypothetical protein
MPGEPIFLLALCTFKIGRQCPSHPPRTWPPVQNSPYRQVKPRLEPNVRKLRYKMPTSLATEQRSHYLREPLLQFDVPHAMALTFSAVHLCHATRTHTELLAERLPLVAARQHALPQTEAAAADRLRFPLCHGLILCIAFKNFSAKYKGFVFSANLAPSILGPHMREPILPLRCTLH